MFLERWCTKTTEVCWQLFCKIGHAVPLYQNIIVWSHGRINFQTIWQIYWEMSITLRNVNNFLIISGVFPLFFSQASSIKLYFLDTPPAYEYLPICSQIISECIKASAPFYNLEGGSHIVRSVSANFGSIFRPRYRYSNSFSHTWWVTLNWLFKIVLFLKVTGNY